MANGDQMQDTYSCTLLIIQLQMAHTFANSSQKIWIHFCRQGSERQSYQNRKAYFYKAVSDFMIR